MKKKFTISHHLMSNAAWKYIKRQIMKNMFMTLTSALDKKEIKKPFFASMEIFSIEICIRLIFLLFETHMNILYLFTILT